MQLYRDLYDLCGVHFPDVAKLRQIASRDRQSIEYVNLGAFDLIAPLQTEGSKKSSKKFIRKPNLARNFHLYSKCN